MTIEIKERTVVGEEALQVAVGAVLHEDEQRRRLQAAADHFEDVRVVQAQQRAHLEHQQPSFRSILSTSKKTKHRSLVIVLYKLSFMKHFISTYQGIPKTT